MTMNRGLSANILTYYMAVSYKYWERPISRIRLAEIDIESSLDFPINGLLFAVKKFETKMQNLSFFF